MTKEEMVDYLLKRMRFVEKPSNLEVRKKEFGKLADLWGRYTKEELDREIQYYRISVSSKINYNLDQRFYHVEGMKLSERTQNVDIYNELRIYFSEHPEAKKYKSAVMFGVADYTKYIDEQEKKGKQEDESSEETKEK